MLLFVAFAISIVCVALLHSIHIGLCDGYGPTLLG